MGPVVRTSQDANGDAIKGGDVPASGNTQDPYEGSWSYPNIWDASTFPRPDVEVLPDGVNVSDPCRETPLYPTGRCNRYIIRPRVIGESGEHGRTLPCACSVFLPVDWCTFFFLTYLFLARV